MRPHLKALRDSYQTHTDSSEGNVIPKERILVGLLTVSPNMHGEKLALWPACHSNRPSIHRKEFAGFSTATSASNCVCALQASSSVATANLLAACTFSSTSGRRPCMPQGSLAVRTVVRWLRCRALVIVLQVGAQWITKWYPCSRKSTHEAHNAST